MLGRRALSAGRLAALGATLEFHHGLLTARGRSGDYATVSALLARKQKAPRKSSSLRSLKVTDSFKTFVLEQLADLEDLTARAMFGGVGLYAHGLFFGIIARDRLYLKVDDVNRLDYERMGSRPFKPYPDRSGTMQYYEVPVSVLESALELSAWARKAIAVARRC